MSAPAHRLLPALLFLSLGTGAPLGAQQPAPGAGLDALFREGSAAYSSGNYALAAARLEELVKQSTPGASLESIHVTIAWARLKAGDHARAINAFRDCLRLYPQGTRLDEVRAGLTKALVESGRLAEALAAIQGLRDLRQSSGAQGVDNYASVVSLVVEVADALLADKKAAPALALLQSALDRDEVLVRQRERIAELDRLSQLVSATGGAFGEGSARAVWRDTLASRLREAREALQAVEKTPAFDLPRMLRQGRCHLELDQPWEAVVVYSEILDRFPESPDRAYAMHGLVFAWRAAGRPAATQRLCQRFLSEFPKHALTAEVAALGGQVALELQQTDEAQRFFGTALETSQGELKERMVFQLAIARFAGRDWNGAREMFDRYVREFPKGEWAENAAYRSAVSWFLDTDDIKRYEKAEKALAAFIKARPSSTYLPDARYRLAICKFAFQEYEQALEACTDWEKAHPDDGLLPEVLSLRGDILKTLDRPDRALETYLRAASAASTDEVLSYALDESARLLQSQKNWTRLGEVFRTQVSRQPESPLVFGWYYWIARADAQAGRPEEAWDFLAGRIGPAFDDPAKEDVENILQLMAQIRARRRPASAETPPPAPPTLRERLGLPQEASALAEARLRYYEAALLRLARKPAEAAKLHLEIGRDSAPDKLSAPLLAETGDALLQAGDADRARASFEALLALHPRSAYRDYAYTGLGDLALSAGDAAAALKFHEDAVDVAGARHRLREATVGKARALLALGRLDESEKLFESVAAAKEWRGESTALSLHHLGLVALQKQDLPRAIAFFQRVFVSQGRYPDWVARSYLECAGAFEKLGKPAEAAATYREFLRNDRLRDRPELALARERLALLHPSP